MDLLPLVQHLTRGALRARGVQSRRVVTSHADLHLYDAPGRGPLPTIVVMHGIGSNASAFGRVVEELRSHARRVIAPEAPGHGFSDVPRAPLTPDLLFEAVSELLDRELDEPAIVFGNSLGGGLALRFAIERPSRVRALVVCSPAGAPMSQAQIDAFLPRFDLRSNDDAKAFLGRLYHRSPWYAPLLAPSVRGLLDRPHIRHFLASVSPHDCLDPADLAKLVMPVLLLWGKADGLMPAEQLAFFREHLPAHARIDEPARFGHSPQLEHPKDVAGRIAAFARMHGLHER